MKGEVKLMEVKGIEMRILKTEIRVNGNSHKGLKREKKRKVKPIVSKVDRWQHRFYKRDKLLISPQSTRDKFAVSIIIATSQVLQTG